MRQITLNLNYLFRPVFFLHVSYYMYLPLVTYFSTLILIIAKLKYFQVNIFSQASPFLQKDFQSPVWRGWGYEEEKTIGNKSDSQLCITKSRKRIKRPHHSECNVSPKLPDFTCCLFFTVILVELWERAEISLCSVCHI